MNSNAYLDCLGNSLWWYGYDSYFTYRVDVLGGPAEYFTVAISGAESTGACYPYWTAQHAAARRLHHERAAGLGLEPGERYRAGPGAREPAAQLPHNVPYLFDQSVEVAGQLDRRRDVAARTSVR